ncbi:hypothetical protein G7Y89_g8959 [Cudoniella acicularis]|uniref:Alpha/beta-hydrolase n=1 Tax=Cudoniella acicularis TaxID=354080 RepID=A0A8H4W2D4_9HELO|nr:hypothetical protein G7Y89_g8959 [Cudoniella acicularis]
MVSSQFPPEPVGVNILKSKFYENVTISYKEASFIKYSTSAAFLSYLQTFICETTPDVRSYSGYVHLPPDTLVSREYPINMFFWFFESRVNPQDAPLAIWLNGGPGASSTTDTLGENGPCIVLGDSNSTQLNPWSWNNKVNMLYIDQPVQVGFSYDTLANGTFNILSTSLRPVISDFSVSSIPEQNDTLFLFGAFFKRGYAKVMVEGDIIRGGFLEILSSLLDCGVQAAFMYGDRDNIGNWMSGEKSSLAINLAISAGFASAGYANISTNATYSGRVVRQHGGLSFSRVFEAARGVPCYQPETAYRIFDRAIFHKDIATGQTSVAIDVEQMLKLAAGLAVVKDWVVVGYVQGNMTVLY